MCIKPEKEGSKMKKVLFSLAVVIMLLGALTDATLAGSTSYGIPVSCTIPAIPGVNAPLVKQETLTAGPQLASLAESAQTIEKEQLSTTQDGILILTKTFYSR